MTINRITFTDYSLWLQAVIHGLYKSASVYKRGKLTLYVIEL